MSNIYILLKLLCQPTLAGGTDLLEPYQRTFAETIIGNGSLPVLAFWRGRVALWTILRAAGVTRDDEVILSAYTCEVVPTAVKFAGGQCVFVDVEHGCLNPSVQQIADAITKQTRAVILQHTYGIVQPVWEVKSLIAGRKITLIEDCCQLVADNSYFQNISAASDAAFFSTQWSKPFSTGLGGMAVFFDENLYNASRNLLAAFPTEQNRKRARSLATQILLHNLTVYPRTEALIARIYRWAQGIGLVQGTTCPEEYAESIPSNYLAGAVNVQAILGTEELSKWGKNVSHRCMLTEYYLNSLLELGVNIFPMKTGSGKLALWAIPLFVENAGEILTRAGRAGLPIASWFIRPPVHLVPPTADRYNYHMGQCPESERKVTREIHLLTAPSVTFKRAEEAVKLIKQYARIINY